MVAVVDGVDNLSKRQNGELPAFHSSLSKMFRMENLQRDAGAWVGMGSGTGTFTFLGPGLASHFALPRVHPLTTC